MLDTELLKQQRAMYADHVATFGSGDDFFRTQGANRQAAVDNFYRRSKSRE